MCRCSQCKAIRTGGGYIILDLGDENGHLKTRDGMHTCGPAVVMYKAVCGIEPVSAACVQMVTCALVMVMG